MAHTIDRTMEGGYESFLGKGTKFDYHFGGR